MEATITMITIALTPEGNLELPPEIREKFANGEKYSVVADGGTIVFKKVPKLDWDELRKRRRNLKNELEPLNPEEICEIVREVRKEIAKQ